MAEKWNYAGSRRDESPLAFYRREIKQQHDKESRWKYLAIAAGVCLVVSFGVLAWAVSLPKAVPLVITVSDWGEAKYVGNISSMNYAGLKVPEIAIEYQLRKFVNNIYAVPTDSMILKDHLIDCYASVTAECSSKMTAMLKDDDPRKKVGTTVCTVETESILKLSSKSYQIDFIVTNQDKGGKVKSKVRMRGVLEVTLLQPTQEDQIKNPLGIYISNFDFTVISKN